MKEFTYIARRKEDGKSKGLGKNINNLEQAKEKAKEIYSYGNIEIIKRTKIIEKETQEKINIDKVEVNKGIKDSLINKIEEKCDNINIGFSTPDPKSDSVGVRHAYRRGSSFSSMSANLNPNDFDFVFWIDSQNNNYFNTNINKKNNRKFVNELIKNLNINLEYVAQRYNNFDKMARSNRNGKKLQVYTVMPREEMYGYKIKNTFKNIDNFEVFSPIEIKVDNPILSVNNVKDNTDNAFICLDKLYNIPFNSDLALKFNEFNKLGLTPSEVFEKLEINESPEKIKTELEKILQEDIKILSAGVRSLRYYNKDERKVKPGVYITKSSNI